MLVPLRHEVATCEIRLQSVFSQYLIIKGSGLIELCVKEVVAEYARRYSNNQIKSYLVKSVSYENALNCNKIKMIFDRFSSDWWSRIEAATSNSERSAVDSIKTLRDQIAHGGQNGTGFSTVEQYYINVKRFSEAVCNELIP